jgi:hypothetical protein
MDNEEKRWGYISIFQLRTTVFQNLPEENEEKYEKSQ